MLEIAERVDPAFREDVLAGLSAPIPAVPARWLYDRRGSELFDEITRLPAYYPTRTETALLKEILPDIAARVHAGAAVVEFGAGSATKTPLLLEALKPAAYVPVDISGDYLRESAVAVSDQFPAIAVEPVVADFARPFDLPESIANIPKLGFFPGSTIGNFEPEAVVRFLRNCAELLGPGGEMLIGADLKKEPEILEAAYNDRAGINAAFNLNLLERINRELGGDLDVDRFEHLALYNEEQGRMELYVRSTAEQSATISGRRFNFAAGERIHTENSYKYAIDEFHALARRAGFAPVHTWTDQHDLFSVHYFRQG